MLCKSKEILQENHPQGRVATGDSPVDPSSEKPFFDPILIHWMVVHLGGPHSILMVLQVHPVLMPLLGNVYVPPLAMLQLACVMLWHLLITALLFLRLILQFWLAL